MADWRKSVGIGFKAEGEEIFKLFKPGHCQGNLGQSLWLREVHGHEGGTPPLVDLEAERVVGTFVRQLVADGGVTAAHDVSDGGVLVAIVEMALAGNIVSSVSLNGDDGLASELFAEDQACYIVTISGDGHEFIERAGEAGVEAQYMGMTLAAVDELPDMIIIHGDTSVNIPLATLRAAHEGFFPKLMDG